MSTIRSSAPGDLNIAKSRNKPGDAEPGYTPDPLAGLSHSPIMRDRGLYVDGGISEYSVAFLAPMQSIRASMKPGESLVEFVKRSNDKDPEILRKLAYAALPERVPASDAPLAPHDASHQQRRPEHKPAGNSLGVFMRGVASLLFQKPA